MKYIYWRLLRDLRVENLYFHYLPNLFFTGVAVLARYFAIVASAATFRVPLKHAISHADIAA